MIEGIVLAAANHLLTQSAWARARLAPFAGRRARFVMPPWDLAVAVVDDGGLSAAADSTAPDVTVTLPPDTPLVALQGLDRAMASAHVTGNAEFATELSFVLKNLRWDAEEDLSRLVGDIAAHRLAGAATAFGAWHKRSAQNLAENVSEFLSEEAGVLVPARDLPPLRHELEALERRLAALEARVRQLN